MNWHEFIFSGSAKFRRRRQLTFWCCWWIFIVFTVFFTSIPVPASRGNVQPFFHFQPGLAQLGIFFYTLLVLVKSLLLTLVHAFFCLAILYYILPRFRHKKNYIAFAGRILALSILVTLAGFFLYTTIYPFIDGIFGLHLPADKNINWRSIDAGILHAVKITLIASGFLLLKNWWLKQKEKEKLEREKVNTELQLLKVQVQPAFLFNTLSHIIVHTRAGSPEAPEMLIRFSDLLSYMLYDADASKVNLEKEVSHLKEFITLEKNRLGERLEITYRFSGQVNGQQISPLLLLPFVDHSISYAGNTEVEKAWVSLDIRVAGNELHMKLLNGIPPETSLTPGTEQALRNCKKRLERLYPGMHELKITAGQELMSVYLYLNLEDNSPLTEIAGRQKTVVQDA